MADTVGGVYALHQPTNMFTPRHTSWALKGKRYLTGPHQLQSCATVTAYNSVSQKLLQFCIAQLCF